MHITWYELYKNRRTFSLLLCNSSSDIVIELILLGGELSTASDIMFDFLLTLRTYGTP